MFSELCFGIFASSRDPYIMPSAITMDDASSPTLMVGDEAEVIKTQGGAPNRGYLTVAIGDRIHVNYIGSAGDELGWVYGRRRGSAGDDQIFCDEENGKDGVDVPGCGPRGVDSCRSNKRLNISDHSGAAAYAAATRFALVGGLRAY
jgi:hypothetical protein